ncbi:MAG: beta-glucosidase, partial [Flavobacteriaceae bacterium]|nr:beta-glucosidase [Flavobacteriaceae bacterium]
MKKFVLIFIVFILVLPSCGEDKYVYEPFVFPADPGAQNPTITDTDLLDLTQRETFKYFWNFAEINSGAARERYLPNNPSHDANTVAVGGTGFGLMSILVGIERG